MLIAFTVDNFLSFAYRQTLSMIPSIEAVNGLGHRVKLAGFDVLKTAVLYGANASGKSNFIKAIAAGRDFIVDGLNDAYRGHYSKTGSVNRDRPTLFEYTFYNDGRVFTYGFEVWLSRTKLSGEWLYEIDPRADREKLLFERDAENERIDFGEGILRPENFHQEGFTLSLPGLKETGLFRPAFFWFKEKLKINHRERARVLSTRFPEDKEKFFSVFEKFDTGIVDIEERKIAKDDLPFEVSLTDNKHSARSPAGLFTVDPENDAYYEMLFRHRNSDFLFSYGEESDGTRRLFDFADLIANPVDHGAYIFDEIDRGIHPLLGRKLVEMFNSRLAGFPCQLIFSTHNAGLLSDDLFRRDEVWFVEKGEDNVSRLFSLDIFKERYRDPQEAYLRGAFGAVPMLEKNGDENGD